MTLRSLLASWSFSLLEIQFTALVVTVFIACRAVRFRATATGAAVVLFALTWMIAATLPPRTNRIFYDEHIYQGVAHNMSDSRRTEMCNEGQIDNGRLHCLRGEYNKEPSGYPYLLSLLYRVGGADERWAFRLNNATAGAAALVAMLIAAVLFRSAFAAATAGVVMMLTPMQLTWSNTAAAEPLAALGCGASVLAAAYFTRVRSNAALAATVSVTAFATTIRPECVLVVPLVALTVLVLAPDEWRRRRLWIAAAAGLLLLSPSLLHLLAVRQENWGTTGSRLAWQHAVANAPVNFRFYLADERFPAIVGAAALIGLPARERLKERAIVLAFFLVFWTIFVFFYAGSYNYGADVRYSLLTYIPLAVLAGLGVERLARAAIERLPVRISTRSAWLATTAALVWQFLWYTPLVRATGEEAWAARSDVAYARMFAMSLPPNSLVLTHNPSMFLLWGVNAAQLSIAANEPSYVRDQLFGRYAGGVYLHWNFWCNVADPVQVKFCDTTLALFPHERLDSRVDRNYTYSLYRLRPE